MKLVKWLMISFVFVSSFGTLSVSRGADAVDPLPRTARYTKGGAAACLRCHSGEAMRAIEKSVHGEMNGLNTPLAQQGCEACHGPGSIHVSRAHGGVGFPELIDFGRGKEYSPRDTQVEACMACHGDEKSGASVIGWYTSPHDRKSIYCITCHTVHSETEPMQDADQQVSWCKRCHRKAIEKHKDYEGVNIDLDSLPCGSCHDVHEAFDPQTRNAGIAQ